MVDATALEIAAGVLRGARPPEPPPSHYAFARTLRLPGGRGAGRFYDPDSDACQRFVLRSIDSGRFRRIALCAPPQIGGKTQSAVLPTTLRAILKARQLVGYGLPTLQALDKAWNEKIDPSIRGSGYGDFLPKRGPGSKGGRPDVVYFRDPITDARLGGIVFMTGGAFGSTVAVVVVDDVDKFEKKGKADREAVEDILHRTDSYGDQALCVVVGTIEWDVGSLILAIIEDSTDSRPWAQCPSCGTHQLLVWENVACDYTTDTTARDSARYRCASCAVLWTEEERLRSIEHERVLFCDRGQRVEKGAVVGEPSQSLTFGLTWGALESSRADMRDLCIEYRLAKLAASRGDHSLMRKFWRYRLCRPYTADIDEQEAGTDLTWNTLLDRSMTCQWGPALHLTDRAPEYEGHLYSRHVAEPPGDAIACAGGVDIQNNRAYTSLVAFSSDGTTWDTAWSYEFARADHRPWSKGELHAMLDRIDGIFQAWSRDLPLVGVGLDTGDFTDELLAWQRGHRGSWIATKGAKTTVADSPRDIPGILSVNDEGLHLLNVNSLRELIHAAYRRPNGSIGAAHIPNGLANNPSDIAYLKHLCAEKVILDPKTRKRRVQQGPGRWDWQDARRIAEAMIRRHLAGVSRPKAKVVQASEWFNRRRS